MYVHTHLSVCFTDLSSSVSCWSAGAVSPPPSLLLFLFSSAARNALLELLSGLTCVLEVGELCLGTPVLTVCVMCRGTALKKEGRTWQGTREEDAACTDDVHSLWVR